MTIQSEDIFWKLEQKYSKVPLNKLLFLLQNYAILSNLKEPKIKIQKEKGNSPPFFSSLDSGTSLQYHIMAL